MVTKRAMEYAAFIGGHGVMRAQFASRVFVSMRVIMFNFGFEVGGVEERIKHFLPLNILIPT